VVKKYVIIPGIIFTLFAFMVPLFSTAAMIEIDPVIHASQAPTLSSLRSNRYTQVEDEQPIIAQNLFADLDGYTYRGTKQGLSFYDKPTDLSFRIVDERSGYIWASSVNYDYFLEEDSLLADDDDIGLNPSWQSRLRSPFFLSYYRATVIHEEYLFENFRSTFTYQPILEPDQIGFRASVSLFLSKIRFSFEVVIDQAGLKIAVLDDTIEEDLETNFRLSSIAMYPLLGATKRLRTPGYVVIPDGVGALIRFDDDPEKGVFTKRYFGDDAGLTQTRQDTPLFANMYGLVHGVYQHGMLGLIESGSGNAILTHYGSQVFFDFNLTYITFNYRTAYIQYLNQAKTQSVSLVQRDYNRLNPVLRYQFLLGEQASYIGIAQQYRDYYLLDPMTPLTTLPLHLDILGLETKPGIFSRQPVVMTTLANIDAIVTSLQLEGIASLHLAYLGWNQGGYSFTAPEYVRLDPLLGTNQALSALNLRAEAEGWELYLTIDPFRAHPNSRGFRQSDVLQTIGQEFVYDGYYYLTPNVGLAGYQRSQQALSSLDIHQFALETIGSNISSHHGQDPFNKSEAMATLAQLTTHTGRRAYYQPFSYLWADGPLLDIPMYSSQQARFSDTVPLLPYMVLNRLPAFGRAGNFFSNTRNELLRMIDYHVYPAFFVTEASAYALMDTPSSHIFTSRFADWKDTIQSHYQYVSLALNHVLNTDIRQRDVLLPGVIKLTYDNDVVIYVNYSGQAYAAFEGVIPAMDYGVFHGE